MQRLQYHRYGGPEVLRLDTVEIPTPHRGEVRVQVKAAAANPADFKVRAGDLKLVSGSRFPRGMGHDFAGMIDAVGPDVAGLKVGDAVYGVSGIRRSGAFSDYLIIDEKDAYPKPASISFELAGAIPMASVTAWSAVVDRAKIQSGQSVFIAGCLGGLGRAAVQIALGYGAEVAGSCSAAGREEASALGVKEIADYRAFDVETFKGRFDLVFDTPGALSPQQCAVMLNRDGVAVHAAPKPRAILACLLSSRHKIASGNPNPSRMAGVTGMAEQGRLSPKIGRTASLSEAIAALNEWERTGTPKGKLVIVPRG